MRIKYLGEAVREQRKLLGVPQELVCEGLCTIMTLSRFESGKQTIFILFCLGARGGIFLSCKDGCRL